MIRRIIKKILPRPVIDFIIYHLYYKFIEEDILLNQFKKKLRSI